MISIKDLLFQYNKSILFNKINLDIPPGSLTAVFGPNGIGKTTFLKLISGMINPCAGTITIDTDKIGFLVQRNALDIHFPLTLMELADMGHLGNKDGASSQYALKAVDLWSIRHKYLDEISGGQFQRGLFARLIVQNPDLILLDEPFNAIDCQTLNYLLKQIQIWHGYEKTILVVLHDFDLIQKYFEECIFIGSDFVRKLKVSDITYEQMTQMMFCGQHYAS